jgi:hypothetical protein
MLGGLFIFALGKALGRAETVPTEAGTAGSIAGETAAGR